jgi:uncharacterized protein (TIGR02996 family)
VSLEEAFLRDVGEHPDDDAPRLAYADWLQEQPDPVRQARGEFIVAQCAVARDEERGAHREQWKKRTRALLKQYRDDWLPFPFGLVHRAEFRRGFLERVTLDVSSQPPQGFLDAAQDVFCREPAVRHLRLIPTGASLSPGGLFGLLGVKCWPRLITLALENNELSPETIRALANSPRLAGLRRLVLSGNPIGPHGANALAGSIYLTGLEALVLNLTGVGGAGITALARSPHLGRLLFLGLSGNNIEPAGLIELARSTQLSSLRALDLSNCRLEARHLHALLAGPLVHRLRRLDLSDTFVTNDVLVPLLVLEPRPASLVELRLGGCSDEMRARFHERLGARVHF